MTRETKIGLLVGLAFIIVIGILLSDHIRATGQPPEASLADAGPIAREAVDSPGIAHPPITLVVPQQTAPTQSVPTRDELNRPPSPVIPSPTYRDNPPSPDQLSTNEPSRPSIIAPPAQPQVEDHGADMPPTDLNAVAQRHGESLEPANMDGSTRNNDQSDATPDASPKSYKAQPGDTLSRMASRLLGANTRTNRQALIAANPSLHDDPDHVVAGQTYWIPAKGKASPDSAAADAAPAPRQSAPMGEYFYTVRENDSLWRIANDELGDPSAVDAIKELNADILKGDDHDMVIPGMKLRLPAKPVASAAN